ncbi:MAG TPA: hypothetical protein GXZ87_06920 [Bacteroidales bacterium]|nr:hypothetical protein [Bacteroidales bacterium]
MKKLSMLFVALISLSVVFTSCENDEPKLVDINVKVVDGSNYDGKIDLVQAYAYGENDEILVGEAKYQNGGFNMKLNAVLSSNLMSIDNDDLPENIKVSDKTAKVAAVESFLALKDNDEIGMFICTNLSLSSLLGGGGVDNMSVIAYFYTDKDLKITGTESKDDYTAKFDVSLKMGWNTVVVNTSRNSLSVTSVKKIPSDYKWYFIPHDGDFYSIMPNVKSFLK